MKSVILTAAVDILALHGLNNWTVEEVANRAHCAKGLVNYHYRSKADLLATAAATLRDDRAARRLAAAHHPGSQAVDQLWTVVAREVDSGWFAAWQSLVSADEPLRRAAATRSEDALALAAALGKTLGLGAALHPEAGLIQAVLDGLELQLLQGAPRRSTEEAWHRFWLRVLP